MSKRLARQQEANNTSGQTIQQAAKQSHKQPNDITSGQMIQQAAKQSHKWPTDLTSGQMISQAAAKQENGQNRTVIGETHTNSVTCAAEKKRVRKSCKSSASFVENPR